MSDEAREEILGLMYSKENRPVHVRHVSHLATQIFDGLQALHGLGPRERLLLEASAHLHDIGHSEGVTPAGHHKESARLIREHAWQQLNPADVEIIAQVSRYHRKSIPDMSHDEFRMLAPSDQRTIQVLASLLRLADSLDRTHEQRVTSVDVEVRPNQLVLRLTTTGPVDREIRALYKKADLAGAVFQRDVLVMIGDEIIPPPPPVPPVPDPL
jgi:exopolyphosphatase/guanosine-5'-triphosphate,3'-diphosphate pyrophosphatase